MNLLNEPQCGLTKRVKLPPQFNVVLVYKETVKFQGMLVLTSPITQ